MDYSAWIDAVQFLGTTPDGPDARRVLATMNARQLFRVALFSRKMYAIVAGYLDHLKDFGMDPEPDDVMDVSDDDTSDTESAGSDSDNGETFTTGEVKQLSTCL
jgi:hypothetical protein